MSFKTQFLESLFRHVHGFAGAEEVTSPWEIQLFPVFLATEGSGAGAALQRETRGKLSQPGGPACKCHVSQGSMPERRIFLSDRPCTCLGWGVRVSLASDVWCWPWRLPSPLLDALLRRSRGAAGWGTTNRRSTGTAHGRGGEEQSSFSLRHRSDDSVPYPTMQSSVLALRLSEGLVQNCPFSKTSRYSVHKHLLKLSQLPASPPFCWLKNILNSWGTTATRSLFYLPPKKKKQTTSQPNKHQTPVTTCWAAKSQRRYWEQEGWDWVSQHKTSDFSSKWLLQEHSRGEITLGHSWALEQLTVRVPGYFSLCFTSCCGKEDVLQPSSGTHVPFSPHVLWWKQVDLTCLL